MNIYLIITFIISEKELPREYFWNRISDDALTSTVITILVFILGYLLDHFYKKYLKNEENKEVKFFVHFHLLKITESYLPKIVTKYHEVSEVTTIDSGVLTTPPKILSNDFQRILKIDSVLLFNCFKERKNISNIISQVEFIDQLLNEVQIYHHNFFSKSDPMREKLESELYDYFSLLAEFLEFENNDNNNTKYPETNRLINELIIFYYSEFAGTRQLQRLMDEIIRVIQTHLVEKELYRDHLLAKQIVAKGKSISHLFTSILDLTKEYCDQYQAFSEMMNNSKNSLIENINKIKWNLSKKEK